MISQSSSTVPSELHFNYTAVLFGMAEKEASFAQAEHLENSAGPARECEEKHHSQLATELPLQEALESRNAQDQKRLRRIQWKVDLRLTLMLAVMYTFAFIDRSNLGNVRKPLLCRALSSSPDLTS